VTPVRIELNTAAISTQQVEPVDARPVRRASTPAAQQTTAPRPQLVRHLGVASNHFDVQADPVTKEIVIRVVDANTGQVIRQIPSEEMLRMAQAIAQQIASQSAKRSNESGA
jgi:flagellar protein FlaG